MTWQLAAVTGILCPLARAKTPDLDLVGSFKLMIHAVVSLHDALQLCTSVVTTPRYRGLLYIASLSLLLFVVCEPTSCWPNGSSQNVLKTQFRQPVGAGQSAAGYDIKPQAAMEMLATCDGRLQALMAEANLLGEAALLQGQEPAKDAELRQAFASLLIESGKPSS